MFDNSAFHGSKIIIQEDGNIITDTREICDIFNTYFTSVTNNIGFDNSIQSEFDTEDGFSNMISKHYRNPIIFKKIYLVILCLTSNLHVFVLRRVISCDQVHADDRKLCIYVAPYLIG